jgi:hypothetical protein
VILLAGEIPFEKVLDELLKLSSEFGAIKANTENIADNLKVVRNDVSGLRTDVDILINKSNVFQMEVTKKLTDAETSAKIASERVTILFDKELKDLELIAEQSRYSGSKFNKFSFVITIIASIISSSLIVALLRGLI